MKLRHCFVLVLVVWFSVALTSCGGGGGDELQGEGIFTLISNQYVDFAPLERDAFFAYENSIGNLYKVYDFKYYVSEIVLHKAGGGTYEVPMVNDGSKGYFLIDDADPESKFIILRDVPVGNYESISFLVGVDASKVDVENAVGPLSAARGMYDQATGEYFSANLVGMSYESAEPERAMGLRTGSPHLFRASFDFGNEVATIKDGKETILEYRADLALLFDAPVNIDFSITPLRLNPEDNRASAFQFSEAFSFDHVHNNP